MIVMLKGVNGGKVIVNTDNLVLIDSMNTEKGPIIGQSVAMMSNGVNLSLKGTPEEIYGSLRRSERANESIEIAQ